MTAMHENLTQDPSMNAWLVAKAALIVLMVLWFFAGIVWYITPSESDAPDGYAPHVGEYIIAIWILVCAPGMALMRKWAAVGAAVLGAIGFVDLAVQFVGRGFSLGPMPGPWFAWLFGPVVSLMTLYPIAFTVRYWNVLK